MIVFFFLSELRNFSVSFPRPTLSVLLNLNVKNLPNKAKSRFDEKGLMIFS